MSKYIFILSFLFIANNSFAQDSTKNDIAKKIVFSSGLSYQNKWAAEFTMMYANYEMSPCNYAVYGFRLGSEFVFDNKSIFIAPKIGYQIAGMFICMRISEINYLHHHTVDIRILPEIGFDIGTLANLCYGYNIHLMGDKYSDISNHRLTLTINLYADPKKKK